ncbi:MAG: hypothetical protein JO147_14325 [Actinobacteria bacterium]|nr:hypothetical protein [Actinomycetota bacterium]
MYVWIWHHLPGNAWWKALQSLVLVAAVSALLLFVIFPWLEPRLWFTKVTVGD